MTLWFCRSHPATPLAAKVVAFAVVAYALSPIDLIPDFIPVLGFLDDLIIVPAGIYVALSLIPTQVIAECRARAESWFAARQARPRNYFMAVIIVGLWMAAGWWLWGWVVDR